jgi:hypothetical protein
VPFGVACLVLSLLAVGDLAVEALLLLARVGELVGVFERSGELVAGGGGFAQRLGAITPELLGELGKGLDAVLELADQREPGVAELCAL